MPRYYYKHVQKNGYKPFILPFFHNIRKPRIEMASASPDNIWIVIGDIHANMDNFERIPELDQARGVIITGDLTNNGGVAAARKVLDKIAARNLPVIAQVGNMDKMEIDQWLNENGLNIHRRVVALAPDVAAMGIGGSTITPMNTPTEFTEDQYAAWLNDEWAEASGYPHKALISHNPPRDTLCDAINPRLHVGSIAVRAFIEKRQPEVCLCGHIHEGRAVDKIGTTVIVNPGMLAQGGYAILRERDGRLTAELHEVPSQASGNGKS